MSFYAKENETKPEICNRDLFRLEKSPWGTGRLVYNGFVVTKVPGATIGSLRAGAKKLRDVAVAHRDKWLKGLLTQDEYEKGCVAS